MLRILHTNNSLPYSWPVDPHAEFQAGIAASLLTFGNVIVAGVSDGRFPIGIIDDVKSKAFSAAAIDEVIIVSVPNPSTNSQNQLVVPYDLKVELKNPNITSSSFIADVDVELIPRNGVITFLAGTPLNFSQTNSGVPDAMRVRVSYTYQVPNVLGDDSTMASGRVTVWTSRIIFQTDQYDTSVRYPLNSAIFVNERGLFTTRRISEDYPAVAIVLAPPSSLASSLELLWL